MMNLKFNRKLSLVIIAALLLAVSALPGPVQAGGAVLSPRQLRAELRGGISALEEAGGRTWLKVAAPKLTPEQAERLKRLNSLGYMGGSSILGADRPLVIAPFSCDGPVDRVELTLDPKTKGFVLKIFIATEDEEILFRREIKAGQVVEAAKAGGLLSLKLDAALDSGDYLLGLDFISGEGRIGRVTIR